VKVFNKIIQPPNISSTTHDRVFSPREIAQEAKRLKAIAEAKARCLEMMRDPNRWPAWPLLPVRKDNDLSIISIDRPCGFIIEDPALKHTVFKGNIFMPPEDISTLPKEEFTSFEAMYEAGWRVD
jgi:hypothetical protein